MLTSYRSKEKERKQKLLSIESDIKEISEAMKTAESCFNETTDGDLLDALIYDRAALESRYNYLLRELKALDSLVE
ncbi:MAG: YaaL family protein [Oscillospiraceae bacterium]|nr:YaaL family protein [Oscillospiraceae bacterium]